VVEGTTERVADEFIVAGEDLREFESTSDLAGLVHYWLVVGNPTGEHYVVDIASDSYETLGECLVVEELPEDYIELPDSREEGRNTFEMVHAEDVRCTSCGDHRYDSGGCPECEACLSADLREEGSS
jgi:hypothetical protein